jgi:hypothetical protein
MVAVAIAAVVLAATRAEAESARGTAVVIVGTCVFLLASKRYSEAIALRQARGATISRSQKAGLALASITIAAVVIGFSDRAFLTGYYGYLRVGDGLFSMNHFSPSATPRFRVTGWIPGVILALCVASPLGRTPSGHPMRRGLPAGG